MFKIGVTCEQIDDPDDPRGLIWEAKVDRFPDVRGYSDDPVDAVALAVEAAAELWFREGIHPPVTVTGDP